ncbi:hypothetical protein [Actinocorallia populi]|uniref:hypothetical protein n=1 Tax=Actinocorallia populi TaxID=2079200 RepID=UPI0013002EB2|nr:hypothetical protein [Actinocorallia populi]
MREADIQGIYRHRGRKQAVSGPATENDLVHRGFDIDAPGIPITALNSHLGHSVVDRAMLAFDETGPSEPSRSPPPAETRGHTGVGSMGVSCP